MSEDKTPVNTFEKMSTEYFDPENFFAIITAREVQLDDILLGFPLGSISKAQHNGNPNARRFSLMDPMERGNEVGRLVILDNALVLVERDWYHPAEGVADSVDEKHYLKLESLKQRLSTQTGREVSPRNFMKFEPGDIVTWKGELKIVLFFDEEMGNLVFTDTTYADVDDNESVWWYTYPDSDVNPQLLDDVLEALLGMRTFTGWLKKQKK